MKESLPSKAQQIETIINSKAYELTLKYAGRDESGSPEYSKVFTVTRKEIEEYIKKHYRLNNLPFVFSSIGTKDGIYIIPVPGGYHVYYQERGICDPDYVVPTEEDAWKFYVDFTLNRSGTGLKWE